MPASDTALRLVSAAVIASLKSGLSPETPVVSISIILLEFFPALFRHLRCKVGVYSVSVLYSDFPRVSRRCPSKGREGSVVYLLPYKDVALIDVGKVVVEDIKCVSDEGACRFW